MIKNSDLKNGMTCYCVLPWGGDDVFSSWCGIPLSCTVENYSGTDTWYIVVGNKDGVEFVRSLHWSAKKHEYLFTDIHCAYKYSKKILRAAQKSLKAEYEDVERCLEQVEAMEDEYLQREGLGG